MEQQEVYMNRELSWLKFNERVLEEAENEQVPLAERLSFEAIYQSNLDEFFMVRVGSLLDQMILSGDVRENKTNMTPKEQIHKILKAVRKLNIRKDSVFEILMDRLEENGISMVDFHRLSIEESAYLEVFFDSEILPLLSPTIVGKRQPFPFLKNREIYAVCVLQTKSGKEKLGIVPCSREVFPELVELPTKNRFMLSEELILHFLSKVFSGYKILSKSLMRVTRNADIDADALYDEDLDDTIVKTLCNYLDLDTRQVFRSFAPLNLSFVFQLQDRLCTRPELFFEKRIPQPSPEFDLEKPILPQIKEKDKLLSYPFESMKPFLRMLHEAANDKSVIAIKMTLYRLARQSKVVEALIEAAENGKEVFVMIELKARFDEENNIEWSRRLEEAGCRVVYGLDGYKVHSKLCLITRKTDAGVEYYTQIGTGNYNEKTSRLYTDLSYMTSRVEIGLEAADVFQALDKGETVKETSHLLVAPNCLQNKVLTMIEEEIHRAKAGEEAYIGIKMNSLTDKKIIDKLINASETGVKIDMVIRGINCLIPQVPGKTDNIRVVSIVGRFLEHSRIYIFGCGERKKIYIASADFMTRNTVRRVEVAAPIYDQDIAQRLEEMFITMLSDNQKAREEDGEGNYHLVYRQEDRPLNSQEFFYEAAYSRCE